MKRWYVIAKHWDEERKEQNFKIMGEFDNYMNAHLFQTAYNEYYHADARIYDEYTLINVK